MVDLYLPSAPVFSTVGFGTGCLDGVGVAFGCAGLVSGVGVTAGAVFAFAGGVFGVGVAFGVGVGVTGTGQSSNPLGCITQFASVMNGLCPGATVTVWPGCIGAPGGGTPPFAQGL